MGGDHLPRECRILGAIEASPNGLTVAEIAQREEEGFRRIYPDLEALQAPGFPPYTQKVEKANRRASSIPSNSNTSILSTKAARFTEKTRWTAYGPGKKL